MQEDLRTPTEAALDRLFLCSEVVKQINQELIISDLPNEKADVLLATEALARDVMILLKRVHDDVWGPEQD